MKRMKKTGIFALSLVMILSFSMNVCAKENTNMNSEVLLEQGYTDDGIYFEVFGIQDENNGSTANSTRIVDSKVITRKVVYYSLVTPSNSISWQENIGGSTYSGTLYLSSYVKYPSGNYTNAWYTGTVIGNI